MNASATFQTNPGHNVRSGPTRTRRASSSRMAQHDRAVPRQGERHLHVAVGHHRLRQPEHRRRRQAHAVHQRAGHGLRRRQRDDRRGHDHSSATTTLTFQPTGTTRFGATKLLDLGAQKVFTFRGGKNRLKLMFDAFNIFNINTITCTRATASRARTSTHRRPSSRRASSASARRSSSKQAS